MCLILVAWKSHPKYPCIVAANRDEIHQRATLPGPWWADRPQILAGRDLVAGGTWLGITRTGRWAALTNFRSLDLPRQNARSRGTLVTNVLESAGSTADQLRALSEVGRDYNGFNLMFSDGERLGVFESLLGEGRPLLPGIYGLSNHLLDTPWPKVQKAKARLQTLLNDLSDPESVLEILRDDRPAHDEELPKTGVSLEWERLLSSAFVRGAEYGTRCSTLIRIDAQGSAFFDEWSWDASGSPSGRCSFAFERRGPLPDHDPIH